jgi:hypothetical protein
VSERPAFDFSSVPPELQKAILERSGRKRRPRKVSMTQDEVRTRAFKVLAVIADLTPSQRDRVLRFSTKLNEV